MNPPNDLVTEILTGERGKQVFDADSANDVIAEDEAAEFEDYSDSTGEVY